MTCRYRVCRRADLYTASQTSNARSATISNNLLRSRSPAALLHPQTMKMTT